MQEDLTPSGEEARRKLVHDIRNSLFALRTGIDLLPDLRSDETRFVEIQRILQDEIRSASALVAQLVDPHSSQ